MSLVSKFRTFLAENHVERDPVVFFGVTRLADGRLSLCGDFAGDEGELLALLYRALQRKEIRPLFEAALEGIRQDELSEEGGER